MFPFPSHLPFSLTIQGCYRLVKNFMVDNIQAIGLGIVVAGVIHGLGIVLACILARNVSKAEYEELR